MSLNYGTLKAQILADAHRTDLGDAKAADFVRQAEGVIARRLRAAEMITRIDLTDSDRVTADEGFYTLPSDFLEDRSLHRSDDVKLERVSLVELRRVTGGTTLCHYAILSTSEVEFRGVPSTAEVIELLYFARPATFTDDADVNDILTNHETIYLHAGLSALYEYTQDLELAAAAGSIAEAAIENLNEQAGRMIGGQNTSGAYGLSSYGSY